MAEHIAALNIHGEFRGEQAVLGIGIEIVLRWPARTAAIKAERPMIAPVGAHLQHTFMLLEYVVAPERDAAAIFARTRLVGHELVSGELDRMLGLGHLDRVRGHVGEHVRVAVEPVGPRARTPRAAGEIYVNERLAVLVITADRDAGVAAVARGLHLVG